MATSTPTAGSMRGTSTRSSSRGNPAVADRDVAGGHSPIPLTLLRCLPRANRRHAPIAKRFTSTAGGCGASPQPPVTRPSTHDPEGVVVGTGMTIAVAMMLHANASGRSRGNAFGVGRVGRFIRGCRRNADTPGFRRTRLRRGPRVDGRHVQSRGVHFTRRRCRTPLAATASPARGGA